MVNTNVVIEIDCAMSKNGSGISANIIKCSNCGESKDIPIHHVDEEFWEFQQDFLKKHSHKDFKDSKNDKRGEEPMKTKTSIDYMNIDDFIQKIKSMDNIYYNWALNEPDLFKINVQKLDKSIFMNVRFKAMNGEYRHLINFIVETK